MTDRPVVVGLWYRLVGGCALALLLAAPLQASQRPMKLLETPREAPAFVLPATDGTQRTLAGYRGRYLLVNFWAVWCAPCRKEMPSMQATYDALKAEGLAMIAIHVGPSMEMARDFATELGLEFDIVVDEDMALTDWQVVGLPATFLVDPDGHLVAEAIGERDWADPALVGQLRSLLR
ncbi:MAG: TlpA family protein disulfide reductase [Pseudomonadales bacterium]|nr:TlpA family protein disulfide reductase [Pseudomonadales bacterium]